MGTVAPRLSAPWEELHLDRRDLRVLDAGLELDVERAVLHRELEALRLGRREAGGAGIEVREDPLPLEEDVEDPLSSPPEVELREVEGDPVASGREGDAVARDPARFRREVALSVVELVRRIVRLVPLE